MWPLKDGTRPLVVSGESDTGPRWDGLKLSRATRRNIKTSEERRGIIISKDAKGKGWNI